VTVAALRSVYDSWKDMDLYLAGLLEKVEKDRQGRRKQVIYTVGKKLKKVQFKEVTLLALCFDFSLIYILIDYFITYAFKTV